MKTLDITEVHHTGQELMDAIEKEFNATQRLIVQPYPSEILMRPDQFQDLMKQAGALVEFYGNNEDRMYKTKEGYVMEVKVKYE